MRHLLLLAAAAVAVGCSSGEPESLAALSDGEKALLPVMDYPALKAKLEEWTKQKRRVALVGWSVRHEGSKELYGKLGSLLVGEEKDRPVVLAVNLDGPSAMRSEVLPLVREQGAAIANGVLDGDQMMLLGVVDGEWGGLLPAIWLYDATGKLIASFYGPQALDQAKAKLAEKPAQPPKP